MFSFTFGTFFSTALLSSLVAVLAIWAANGLQLRMMQRAQMRRLAQQRGAVILLDGSRVVDVSTAAETALAFAPARVRTRGDLVAFLAPRFPDIATMFERLEHREQVNIFSCNRSEIASATRRGRRIRLTVAQVEDRDAMVHIDRPTVAAMQDELATLRTTTDKIPVLVWRQTRDGAIVWVNRAYLDTCAERRPDWEPGTWPIPRLFALSEALIDAGTEGAGRAPRVSLGADGDENRAWFHLSVSELDNDDRLITAMDVNAVVETENSLRNVVQTLSKTFADLPIGLAVFTKDRRLTLFNPALSDLMTLPPEQLIARPTIFGFFDKLRSLQMMPEPKNYATWREQITQLEASAADGGYLETWHLPAGRTFRVTGRPQIGGALALLFEDISSEISVTRRLRSELEISQGVIDALDDSVAVFSSTGILIASNTAYDSLWGRNSREGLDDLDIAAAVNGWMAACAPGGQWSDLRAFVMSANRREPWSGDFRLPDGRGLRCTCRQISGGATLVNFARQRVDPGHLRAAVAAQHTHALVGKG